MAVLEHLEPSSVFHYFEEICAIPHTSFHEMELSNYCVKFAKDRNLFCQQDELGNVIIIKNATAGYESVEPIMLQGHLDMVGAKTEDCPTDLETEGLTLIVDGDLIHADRTTLGGDDGIAVAYALAILDADDIAHPRLEVILTVSEEVGLLGATAIDLSACKAKRLINIDSEEEGVITVGCAGGVRSAMNIPVEREAAEGTLVQINLAGLLGGHSGAEIHKGRANAIVLLARLLDLLSKKVSVKLVNFACGVKENVIPSTGKFEILVENTDVLEIETIVKDFETKMAAEYASADPDVAFTCEVKADAKAEVLTEKSFRTMRQVLNLHPNGVQSMSADFEGLVETSLNIGVAEFEKTADKEEFSAKSSVRSSVLTAKEYLVAKLDLLTEMAGGTISYAGDYPAWAYVRDSKLRDICVEVFEKQYGRKPEVTVIHAGLECGLLSDKIKGLDCVSIGPNLYDIHSPKERVSIASVQRLWEYIKAILAVK